MQAESVSKLLSEECGGEKANLRDADRVMRDVSGVQKIILHGCVGKPNGQACQHVYGPMDLRRRCPVCNHGRYKDNTNTANEIVYHFPIRERLAALLQLPNFIKLVQANDMPDLNTPSNDMPHNTAYMLYAVRANKVKTSPPCFRCLRHKILARAHETVAVLPR